MEIILRPWSTYSGPFRVLSTPHPRVLRLKGPRVYSPAGLCLAAAFERASLGEQNYEEKG